MKEIGSEFWAADLVPCDGPTMVVGGPGSRYLLAGRTALDLIIKDIKATRRLESVYMPSYCCHSMIQPFVDNQVAIEFYPVTFRGGRFACHPDDTGCDSVFWLNYFGFRNEDPQESCIERFKRQGKTIIEDATHSYLSDAPFSAASDYVFASLRKWSGLQCGAVAMKPDGALMGQDAPKTNSEFIELRRQAADLKRAYLDGRIGEKQTYLDLFAKAEELLEYDYQGYGICPGHEGILRRLDGQTIALARRANADRLIAGLRECSGIDCILREDGDTPLFVPIMVSGGRRDRLRQFLTDHHVYCPIHWPLSPFHRIKSRKLYDDSLSLVCDQRYTTTDMDSIVALIKEFFAREDR